jgi:hypothetical protein
MYAMAFLMIREDTPAAARPPWGLEGGVCAPGFGKRQRAAASVAGEDANRLMQGIGKAVDIQESDDDA